MRKFWIRVDETGKVLERFSGPSDAQPPDGMVEISVEDFLALSQKRKGEEACYSEDGVSWRPFSRPIVLLARKVQSKLDSLVEAEVVSRAKYWKLMKYLAAHAVLIGIMADPQSTQEQKQAALEKERNVRAWLQKAADMLDQIGERVAEIEGEISSAKSIADFDAVVLSRFSDIEAVLAGSGKEVIERP